MKLEYRQVTSDTRAIDPGSRKIGGTAVLYDVPTVIGDSFVEVIARGAATKTLKDGADIRCLWQHDSSKVLGRTKSGTLVLAENEFGVNYEVDTPDTATGNEARVLVNRGDVDETSFGFAKVADKEEWERAGEWDAPDEWAHLPRRILREFIMYEVSPVTWAAYSDTVTEPRGLIVNPADYFEIPAEVKENKPPQERHLAALARRDLLIKRKLFLRRIRNDY